MENQKVPAVDLIADVVAQMESEGIRVTIKSLVERTGWTWNFSAYSLNLLGKANKRGRPPVDYDMIKRQVAGVVAGYIAEQRHFDESDIVAAIGATRYAVRRSLNALGIRLIRSQQIA